MDLTLSNILQICDIILEMANLAVMIYYSSKK